MSLPKAADEVTSMLASGPAQNDFDLRIQLLAIKGDIEFQYSLPAAQKTWDEAAQLASSRGSGPWKARAEGELGTIAFLNGATGVRHVRSIRSTAVVAHPTIAN
jgi:hypothetical protein